MPILEILVLAEFVLLIAMIVGAGLYLAERARADRPTRVKVPA